MTLVNEKQLGKGPMQAILLKRAKILRKRRITFRRVQEICKNILTLYYHNNVDEKILSQEVVDSLKLYNPLHKL